MVWILIRMSIPPIHVIMRICPDSTSVLSGDGKRPVWFSKEKLFKNLLATKDEHTYITVLFDGELQSHWLHKYPVETYEIKGRSGNSSFVQQLQHAIQKNLSDDSIVYILEDDYVHRPGWPTILREAFRGPVLPNSVKIDYATLYDHRDKYFLDMYNSLVSKIVYTPSIHWRTVPSTTNTFAMTYKVLKEDYDIHMKWMNDDHPKFLELGQRHGRSIVSCIPGYSTHCHTVCLSPCVDWEAILNQ